VQGGYHFMSLQSGLKISRRSWDRIPMPDTVIARVNALGKNQPEQLVFADRKGQLLGDVELPGVDGDEETETPQVETVEDDDLDPEDLAQPADEPKLEQVEEDVQPQFEDDPAPEPKAQQLDPVEIPGVIPGVPEVEAPELRRSSRVKFQTKEPYVPSMSGTKYAVAVAQPRTAW
jgi:hypothetical protein